MSKTELAHVEQPYAPIMPVMQIEQAKQRYQALVELTKSVLREGIDYGTVPGTEKPSLHKPGAEKLTTFFGLRPEFEVIEKIEDWTGADHGGEPFFYYWFRCSLWRGDQKVGEADGSCNSHESKYRWRWVEQTDLPPGVDTALLKCRRGSITEFAFATDKAETSGKYGKPPEYWQQFKDAIENGSAESVFKTTRDGKQYPAWKIDTSVYRIPNEDIATQVNTVLKMAQKRALIAATLITVNASEFFTQDMEDYADEFVEGEFIVEQPQQETTPSPSPPQQPEPPQHTVEDTGPFDPTQIPDDIPYKNFCELVRERMPHYKHDYHITNAYRNILGDPQAPLCDSHGLTIEPRAMWTLLKEHAEIEADEQKNLDVEGDNAN